ncbi:MAG: hypothetical protein ACRC4L_01140, partial [Mycoplasma sp.]
YKGAKCKVYIEYKLPSKFENLDLLIDLSKFRLYTYKEQNAIFLFINIPKSKISIFEQDKEEDILINLNQLTSEKQSNISIFDHDFSEDYYHNYFFTKENFLENIKFEDLSKTYILSSEIKDLNVSINKSNSNHSKWYYFLNKIGQNVITAKILKDNYYVIKSIYENIKLSDDLDSKEMIRFIEGIESLDYDNLLKRYDKCKTFFDEFIKNYFENAKDAAVSNLIKPSYEKSKLVLLWLMKFCEDYHLSDEKWEYKKSFTKYNEAEKKEKQLSDDYIEEIISKIHEIIKENITLDIFKENSLLFIILIINVYKTIYNEDDESGLIEQQWFGDEKFLKIEKRLFDHLYKHTMNKMRLSTKEYSQKNLILKSVAKLLV